MDHSELHVNASINATSDSSIINVSPSHQTVIEKSLEISSAASNLVDIPSGSSSSPKPIIPMHSSTDSYAQMHAQFMEHANVHAFSHGCMQSKAELVPTINITYSDPTFLNNQPYPSNSFNTYSTSSNQYLSNNPSLPDTSSQSIKPSLSTSEIAIPSINQIQKSNPIPF